MFNYFLSFIISCYFILICDSTSLLMLTPPVGKKKSFNYNDQGQTCEEISVPMCRNMPYNFTSMPNQFNHETQQDAALEVHQFWALVEISCSKDLKFFLCSMYTPICIKNYAKPVRACRSVCERARGGCEKYMKKFGFEWPEHMNCNLFPEYGIIRYRLLVLLIVFDLVLISYSQILNINFHIIGFYFGRYFAFLAQSQQY